MIGYMGCGKSTVGRRLSYQVKMPYVDTDKIIEQKQNTTISSIFETQGEQAFRDMETACLKELFHNKQDYVISVGGGLPMREENRVLIGELGNVVYLRAKPETIYERLKDDTTRPLLQGEDPEGKIRLMIEARGPFYEMASDLTIDVDGKTFEEIIAEITSKLEGK